MNCDCIDELKDQIVKEQPLKDKIVEGVRFNDYGLVRIGSSLDVVTLSQVDLIVKDRKRPVKYSIIHSFCPFCGKRINGEATGKEAQS